MWGYNAELERAMVIGPPTEEMRRLFSHMLAAQETAFDALRPGVTCADVDNAVLDYFAANDLMPYWRQHVGHAIGLRDHEAPFLDTGDHTRVEEGMVFTIEPGVYSSEIGGFRHSDTVVVTADGIEILTDYPRDLDSLTIAGLGRMAHVNAWDPNPDLAAATALGDALRAVGYTTDAIEELLGDDGPSADLAESVVLERRLPRSAIATTIRLLPASASRRGDRRRGRARSTPASMRCSQSGS